MVRQSQSVPLPEVPFRLISKSIGQGAYASIRKAVPLEKPTPVFAVKLIHKGHAMRYGRIGAKQLNMEVTLHHLIGRHQNIIEFYNTGEDLVWRWIAMELAEGGDLFDKIEADEGVGEDVAHLYFAQLVGAVGYMHSKHVAHRDLKPENILLSASGDLKLADFGLATLMQHKGEKKLNYTVCGSPPYVAPEILDCGRVSQGQKRGAGYAADQADIWSCGVVLFVLLIGNTPWEEPTLNSQDFEDYVHSNGRSMNDLWQQVPLETLSLLRGMMKIDPVTRFTLNDVRRHPWFTRNNPFIAPSGAIASPLSVATKMLESLRIDFTQEPPLSQPSQRSTDAMEIDNGDVATRFASTQPETPIGDIVFDWERPARIVANERWSASQPTKAFNGNIRGPSHGQYWDQLLDDPSMSQFSATPGVPLSLTQNAQRFRDIVPSHSLARFFSILSFSLLLPLLSESLHRLGIPVPTFTQSALDGRDAVVWIKIKTLDGRACVLSGDIVVEQMKAGAEGLLEVRFLKSKGDPVEWRRLFKKIAVLSKDGVYRPNDTV
ncbi:MAG: Chk1 protein kinase [Candelina submexicana]|nr:MAG: Chk1 protein kinase [Candelina submexicana]